MLVSGNQKKKKLLMLKLAFRKVQAEVMLQPATWVKGAGSS